MHFAEPDKTDIIRTKIDFWINPHASGLFQMWPFLAVPWYGRTAFLSKTLRMFTKANWYINAFLYPLVCYTDEM